MNKQLFYAAMVVAVLVPAAWADVESVKVTGGEIAGIENHGVRVYKGIPYAAPPVGEYRWREPQPVIAWEGVRECTEFGPQAIQAEYPEGSFFARELGKTSEDCLFLNVWTTAKPDEKQAVMVWIHGGALTRGSGNNPVYDGSALAREGVVVVTINYRLNAFGFMAHSELTNESPHKSSGNYGILDQVAALKWVRDNVAAFGGDPDRVTIFGESAGSWSVNCLQATPLAKGLFHRAIGQSGATFDVMSRLSEKQGDQPSAEEQGAAFLEALGVKNIAEARAKSSAEVLKAFEGFRGSLRPTVDGWMLPNDIYTIYAEGKQSDVPVIVGFNADEGTSLTGNRYPETVAAYEAQIRNQYGDRADAVLAAYPAKTDDEVRAAFMALYRDRAFGWNMRSWARMMDTVPSDAYLYYFTHAPSRPDKENWGAYHAAEIMYAFRNLHVASYPNLQEDYRVSDRISKYWINFAKTGNPNGEGLPEWPAYDSESEPYMEFADGKGLGNHLLKDRLDVLGVGFEARRKGM